MDTKDEKILRELCTNGRKSVVEISKELDIPRGTVQERINKLVKTGTIKKFVAIPDYQKIGKPVTAYVFVAFRSEERVSQRDLAEQIARISEIYEVSVISGGWDILLKVRGSSFEEIGSLVVDKLRTMKGIEKTETCVAFQTIKESF